MYIAGPQTYNASPGMAAESMYKAYFASTLRGAFGSSAERKGPIVTQEAREHPGPAHYQAAIAAPCNSAAPRGRIIRATSNFASHSDRIKKIDHLVRVVSVSSISNSYKGTCAKMQKHISYPRIFLRLSTIHVRTHIHRVLIL